MKSFIHATAVFCILNLTPLTVLTQTSMLAEFKAMPFIPTDAKQAFKTSNVITANGYCSYQGSSVAMSTYNKKLQDDNKPNQDIIIDKGKQGMAPGMAAANDFSDLNSPEMQAKLAKMSQEEKIKFAMEIQARMAANKNLQTVNAISKPSPLINIVLKLNKSSQDLFAVMPEFPKGAPINYDKCNAMKFADNDPTYDAKMGACNNKVSKEYYNAEIIRYNTFIKNVQTQYLSKKAGFEADLKEFDTQAAKYARKEIAADNSNVITILLNIALRIEDYEKQGAMIFVDIKNNPYCKKDFPTN